MNIITFEQSEYGIIFKYDDIEITVYTTRFSRKDAEIDIIRKLNTKKLTYSKDDVLSAVNDAYIEFIKTNPFNKDDKRKSSKSSITCPKCGRIALRKKDGSYECIDCKRLFLESGEYITPPWKPEPLPEERIAPKNGIELFEEVRQFIAEHVVLPEEIFYTIDTLWTIMTYKLGQKINDKNIFKTVGYLGFFGMGNEKGKTKALEVMAELSYRGSFFACVTPPCMAKALSDGAAIFIDQAENLFFERGSRTPIYDYWTTGYRRGGNIGKLSAVDHVSYAMQDSFGAKAITMQEDGKLDNPSKQRTFCHYMQSRTPKRKELDEDWSDTLRKKLYWFKYSEVPIDKHTFLRGRIGEIIDPLIITARMLKLPHIIEEELMKHAYELKYEKIEDTLDTLPSVIIQGIEEIGKGEIISPKDLVTWIKSTYPDSFPKITSRGVSSQLKFLGLKNGVHTREGNVYDLTTEPNKSAYSAAKTQYILDGEKDEITRIVEELKHEHGAEFKLDALPGTKAEKFAKMCQYYTFFLKAKEMGDIKSSEVHLNPIEEEIETPDDEYFRMNPLSFEEDIETTEEEYFKQYYKNMHISDIDEE